MIHLITLLQSNNSSTNSAPNPNKSNHLDTNNRTRPIKFLKTGKGCEQLYLGICFKNRGKKKKHKNKRGPDGNLRYKLSRPQFHNSGIVQKAISGSPRPSRLSALTKASLQKNKKSPSRAKHASLGGLVLKQPLNPRRFFFHPSTDPTT